MKFVLILGAILVLVWLVNVLTALAVRRHRRREEPPRSDWPKGDF